jgi:hypothetical protein
VGKRNVHGLIILKSSLKAVKAWIIFTLLRYVAKTGLCEHGFETSGSIKDGQYFDHQFLKEGPYSTALGYDRHIISTLYNKPRNSYAEIELD